MKKGFILWAFILSAFISACTVEYIEPQFNNETIEFNLLANSVSTEDIFQSKTWIPSYSDNNGTQVRWQGSDRMYLIETSDNDYSATLSTGINRINESGKDYAIKANFPMSLIKRQGNHSYWARIVAKIDKDYWTQNNASLKSYPLTIFANQTLNQANVYDPKCDIFFSDMSREMTQEELASGQWKLSLKRHNAIARIWLKGLPDNGNLISVKFVANDADIVGTRNYDLVTGNFAKGTMSKTIEASCGKDYKPYHDTNKKPYYCAHLSLWPSSVSSYDIEAKVKVGNATKTYRKSVLRTSPLVFSANTISQWAVNVEEVQPEEVNKESVSGNNIEGTRTYKLFRDKIKNGPIQDSITTIDTWKTHYLGYDGVTIHEAKFVQYNEFTKMWILEVDPKKADIIVGSPNNTDKVPFESLQTVRGQAQGAKDRGLTVLAAINGDAWGSEGVNNPYGVMYKDGKCIKSYAKKPNTFSNDDVFYITNDGYVNIVDIDTFNNIDKTTIKHAIGGWYRLISRGGESYASNSPKAGDPLLRKIANPDWKNFLKLNPRTFVGITKDNKVFLMVVEGRTAGSQGLTMNGMARICYNLGCVQAINLDGGGSTTMIKRWKNDFEVLNTPSDNGKERAVGNTLMVIAK